MLSKLLKYDFKSMKKFGIILCAIALALGIVGSVDGFFVAKAFSSELLYGEDSSGIFVIFTSIGMLSFMFIIYALFACATVMQVMIYVNYYKNLCTDQGYLTFTLPVKQRDILLSKSINAFIWAAIIFVIILVSVGLIVSGVIFGIPKDSLGTTPPSESLYPVDYTPIILEASLILITGVLYFINNTQLIFMVIFFASVITKKNKGIVAVLLVLATNFVYSSIASVVSSIFSIAFIGSENIGIIIKYLIFITLLVGTGITYFIVTKRMMEKKLNLP